MDLEWDTYTAFEIINQFGNARPFFVNHEIFLQHLIAHFLMVIKENAFDITRQNDSNDVGKVQRLLLFDTVSFLNHSCCPNVINIIYNDEMRLISNQNIQAGHQLSIDYKTFPIDTSKRSRRSQLRKGWNFQCQCKMCIDNVTITIEDMTGILGKGANGGQINYNEDELMSVARDARRFHNFEARMKTKCRNNIGGTREIWALGLCYRELCRRRADR